MLKCDFNKGALQVIEIFFRHRCSPMNLLYIFRIPFYMNSYGGLLLFLPLCNDSMTQYVMKALRWSSLWKWVTAIG